MSEEFRPLPLLGNPHVQTILGSLLRRDVFSFPHQEKQVLLPDGDRLLVYDSASPRWQPGDPMVLLVHGLTGSHKSGYLIRLAKQLIPWGYRVIRMDLRGTGRGMRWARKTYNAACSPDVRQVMLAMNRWSPTSPLVVVGFSLGGNMALKMAGEIETNPVPNLAAVAAVNPPIDMPACSALLSQPENRLYDRYFAKSLIDHVSRHRQYFSDLPKVRFPKIQSLREFDEFYTAPQGGFADADDYYHRAASLPVIPRISVPILLFTARDDPFILVNSFEELPTRPNLHVRIVPRGGHLGYLGLNGQGGIRWAEPQVAQWIWQTIPPRPSLARQEGKGV